MIKYNLRKNEIGNHPLEYRYGVVINSGLYSGYPLTIVDNSKEIKNGKFTRDFAKTLLHLDERIRIWYEVELFNDFLYLNFSFNEPKYRMFDYKLEELSNEQIIKDLKKVFYYLQPNLQQSSLVASSKKGIENDPNYYEGIYVLNDEEEYSILKCGTKYKFYKGRKFYYPDWNKDEGLIFTGDINFDLYKKARDLEVIRKNIIMKTNKLLDGDDLIANVERYNSLKKEVLDDLRKETGE